MAVLATGFGAPLARAACFGKVPEVISGCQAVVNCQGRGQGGCLHRQIGGAWGVWLAVPWRPGLALAGVLTRKHAVRYMADHIRRLQEGGQIGEVQRVFNCRPIPLRLPERSISDGVLGVGDVVSQVKPTTGEASTSRSSALISAAQSVHDAMTLGDVSEAALRSYDARWRGIIGPEVSRGYRLRQLCEQLPEGIVEHLHRLLRIPVLRRIFTAAAPPFDWHSDLVIPGAGAFSAPRRNWPFGQSL